MQLADRAFDCGRDSQAERLAIVPRNENLRFRSRLNGTSNPLRGLIPAFVENLFIVNDFMEADILFCFS